MHRSLTLEGFAVPFGARKRRPGGFAVPSDKRYRRAGWVVWRGFSGFQVPVGARKRVPCGFSVLMDYEHTAHPVSLAGRRRPVWVPCER
jgi:hypothetical protein